MSRSSGLSTKSVALVASGNIALAVVALIRESRLAAFAGTTETADAFLFALYLVDLVGETILAGSVVQATVPVLSRLHADGDRDRFRRTLGGAGGLIALVTGSLWAAACVAGRFLVRSLAGGLSDRAVDLTSSLIVRLAPSIPLFALAALLSSALYVLGRFGIPAYGPVVLNVVFLGGLGLAPTFGLRALAVSWTLGVAAMFSMQLLGLAGSGLVARPTLDWRDPGVAAIVRASLPVMGAVLLSQPGGLVERVLASSLGEGNLAALTYAFKLSQFPVWVFSAALGVVLFPALAASAGGSDSDLEHFKGMLTEGLNLTMFLCLPFTAIFIALARPIASLLFQYGAFDATSLELTAGVLRLYSLGLAHLGSTYVFVRAFYSLGDATSPMKAALAGAGVTIACDVVFARILGLSGLGLGASLGAAVHAVLLGGLLSRKIGWSARAILRSGGRICLAASFVVVVGLVLDRFLLGGIERLTLPGRAVRVGLVLAASACAYLAGCVALGLHREGTLGDMWRRVRQGVATKAERRPKGKREGV